MYQVEKKKKRNLDKKRVEMWIFKMQRNNQMKVGG